MIPESRYTVSSLNCIGGESLEILSFRRTLAYNVCIDAGEKDVTLRLTLGNSFDRRKTIRITLRSIRSDNLPGGVEPDPDKSVLRYPGTAIFLRSKVFLEGPLQ